MSPSSTDFQIPSTFLFKLTDLERFQRSGYELWKIGYNGRIAESKGHFNAAEYERQLKHGVN